MMTKPQDIVIAFLLCAGGMSRTYAELGKSLGLSASEAHAGIRRLIDASLLDPETREVKREAFRNFLLYGLPHVFPARPMEITRGIPTAWAAPVMEKKLRSSGQIPPVWPDPDGRVLGAAVQPLYPSVPKAARNNRELYDLLALADAIRIGRARERNLAEKEISKRLRIRVAA